MLNVLSKQGVASIVIKDIGPSFCLDKVSQLNCTELALVNTPMTVIPKSIERLHINLSNKKSAALCGRELRKFSNENIGLSFDNLS